MTRQKIASASEAGCSSGGRGESTPLEIRQQKASVSSVASRSNGGSGESTPKKRVNGNRKGKEGEREFARALTDAGFPATRG